jgi:predicted DNA-binding transcriptional regulator AlpA
MENRFLRKNDVALRYGITVRSVERMTEDGRLPRPVYRGRFPLWHESELDEFDRTLLQRALAPRAKTEKAAAA